MSRRLLSTLFAVALCCSPMHADAQLAPKPWRNVPQSFGFPSGRAPGVDASHPASKNLVFSGIATSVSGGTFVDLTTGQPGTISGTIIKGIGSIVGPSLGGSGTATEITFSGKSTTAPSSLTMAAIFEIANTGAFNPIISNTSSTAGTQLAVTSFHPVANHWGGSSTTSTLTLTYNVPYFMAFSDNGTNTLFILVNLLTGQMQTNSVASTSATATYNGTVIVANDPGVSATFQGPSGGGTGVAGGLAAVMISNTALSLQQLEAWGADPWAFWYPNKLSLQSMLVGASITPSSSGGWFPLGAVP
jgi:hypothetical protein